MELAGEAYDDTEHKPLHPNNMLCSKDECVTVTSEDGVYDTKTVHLCQFSLCFTWSLRFVSD